MIANITSADATSGVTLVAAEAGGRCVVVDLLAISSEVSTLATISAGEETLFHALLGADVGPFVLPKPPEHDSQLRSKAGHPLIITTEDAGAIAVHLGYTVEPCPFTETPGEGPLTNADTTDYVVALTWITSPHVDDQPEVWVKKDSGEYKWVATLDHDFDNFNYDAEDTDNPYTGDGEYSFKIRWVRGTIAGDFGTAAGPMTVPEAP